jgi:hypothetical protein
MVMGNALEVIQREPEIIKFVRSGGQEEELAILPLPFLKWRRAFKYIVDLAPLFGFDLASESLDNLSAKSDLGINKKAVFQAMQSDEADKIVEFLAFAINKEVAFFEDMYEEAIDIAVAVIKVNIAFFVQRLLPKLAEPIKEASLVIATLRNQESPMSTVGPVQ